MVDEIEVVAPETDNLPTDAPEVQVPEVAPETPVAPDWREDWREKMAGGDEKELKRLARFKSPIDVYKSARELEKKMSSGDVKAKLAADATEEQIAAWRKDNGIPDKPDGYLEKLPAGLVIGEDDKPMLSSYLEAVHGRNASPEIVADTLDWYYKAQTAALEEQGLADTAYKQASDDALRAEWGAEYRANVNSINSFLEAAPVDGDVALKDLLLGARLADGTKLGNNPAALKWLAGLAHDANPAGFIAPASAASQVDGVNEEIAKIEGVMRTNRRAYDKDEAMQARLRTLYDAQEKLAKR